MYYSCLFYWTRAKGDFGLGQVDRNKLKRYLKWPTCFTSARRKIESKHPKWMQGPEWTMLANEVITNIYIMHWKTGAFRFPDVILPLNTGSRRCFYSLNLVCGSFPVYHHKQQLNLDFPLSYPKWRRWWTNLMVLIFCHTWFVLMDFLIGRIMNWVFLLFHNR